MIKLLVSLHPRGFVDVAAKLQTAFPLLLSKLQHLPFSQKTRKSSNHRNIPKALGPSGSLQTHLLLISLMQVWEEGIPQPSARRMMPTPSNRRRERDVANFANDMGVALQRNLQGFVISKEEHPFDLQILRISNKFQSNCRLTEPESSWALVCATKAESPRAQERGIGTLRWAQVQNICTEKTLKRPEWEDVEEIL